MLNKFHWYLPASSLRPIRKCVFIDADEVADVLQVTHPSYDGATIDLRGESIY